MKGDESSPTVLLTRPYVEGSWAVAMEYDVVVAV